MKRFALQFSILIFPHLSYFFLILGFIPHNLEQMKRLRHVHVKCAFISLSLGNFSLSTPIKERERERERDAGEGSASFSIGLWAILIFFGEDI